MHLVYQGSGLAARLPKHLLIERPGDVRGADGVGAPGAAIDVVLDVERDRLHAGSRLAGTYTDLYSGRVVDKPLIWMGTSFEDVRDFPPDARRAAGYELRRVQRGSMPSDWKPMSGIGPGVTEIRVHTRTEHRVFYVAKFEEAVYVLHAFEKKSQQTKDSDLALARERLRQVETLRREGKGK
jgi:phage-related protein